MHESSKELRRDSLLLSTLLILSLLATFLSPAFAEVTKISLSISQQTRNRPDLTIKLGVNIHCSGSTSLGTLTVSIWLYGPDGSLLAQGSQSDEDPVCGQSFYTITFPSVLTQSGLYRIVGTASADGLTVTASHPFDPRTEGSMGPAG